MRQYSIARCCITVGNSKANGLAERVIRVFKEVMRKYLSEYPVAYWSDFVPHALMLLRFTAHRFHGLPPYTVITAQPPSLPSVLSTTDSPPLGDSTGPTTEQEQHYANWVYSRTKVLYQLVLQRRSKAYSRLLAKFKREERNF